MYELTDCHPVSGFGFCQ